MCDGVCVVVVFWGNTLVDDGGKRGRREKGKEGRREKKGEGRGEKEEEKLFFSFLEGYVLVVVVVLVVVLVVGGGVGVGMVVDYEWMMCGDLVWMAH